MRRLNEPSHLDLCCLQKFIVFAYGSERVKEKGQTKSPGSTTITSRNQSLTPRGIEERDKATSQNKQTLKNKQTSSLIPKWGDDNAKRIENTRTKRNARLNIKRLVEVSTNL